MIDNKERIGWICCRCQKSNSPDIKSCDCIPQQMTPCIIQPTVLPYWEYPYPTYIDITCQYNPIDIKTISIPSSEINGSLISANIEQ